MHYYTHKAGTNHIDLAECQTRGIRVINTPGGTADAVSEHALALVNPLQILSKASLALIQFSILPQGGKL
jgi:hypothetical protein